MKKIPGKLKKIWARSGDMDVRMVQHKLCQIWCPQLNATKWMVYIYIFVFAGIMNMCMGV